MKKTHKIVALGLSLLAWAALPGCSQGGGEEPGAETGYLSSDFGFNGAETRAGGPATRAVSPEDFWIKIKNSSTEASVFQAQKSTVADLIELQVGTYVVEAFYPELWDAAAFSQPQFLGTTDPDFPVEIYLNEITRVASIEATMQNMKVTVEFDPSVAERFENYEVTVSNGTGELTYTAATVEAGYFQVAPLTVSFWGNRLEMPDDEVEKVFETTIDNVGPAYHHNLLISANFVYTRAGEIAPQAGAAAEEGIAAYREYRIAIP